MSIFDKLKDRKKKSTRQLIGAKAVTGRSLETYSQGELVFYSLRPQNLAVLSEANISAKLHALTTVLKSVESVEWVCQNSRESFEDNKDFLKRRIEEEDSPKVRELCEKDLAFLDKIQLETATAREFSLILRFNKQKPGDITNQINRFEKLLKEQGFDVRRAAKSDIQRILAVYFEQNVTQAVFDDIDGERFAGMLEQS